LNFIIYDVEATCWEGSPRNRQQEIIEIGAVLIDRYGECRSSFNRFVQPVLNPILSPFCKELTTIEQSDIDRADGFISVVEAFQDWAEIFDEEYLLCSWGTFDKKILISDCELHDIESDWVEHHINIKQQYKEIKRMHRPKGLKSSVKAEGFEFTGTHHRGISDAENLAKLFTKYLDEWRF
jgi:3'-5' exoribonuclease 1